jgi:hypothetical protein
MVSTTFIPSNHPRTAVLPIIPIPFSEYRSGVTTTYYLSSPAPDSVGSCS